VPPLSTPLIVNADSRLVVASAHKVSVEAIANNSNRIAKLTLEFEILIEL
jgi:hypothetical protein